MISKAIGAMSFTYIAISDESSRFSDRAYIEMNAIALLAAVETQIDPPSPKWLGLHSPSAKIRTSGLWNIDHVGKPYDPQFIDVLDTYVGAACGLHASPITSVAPADWRSVVK